jgi:hypothetical protein
MISHHFLYTEKQTKYLTFFVPLCKQSLPHSLANSAGHRKLFKESDSDYPVVEEATKAKIPNLNMLAYLHQKPKMKLHVTFKHSRCLSMECYVDYFNFLHFPRVHGELNICVQIRPSSHTIFWWFLYSCLGFETTTCFGCSLIQPSSGGNKTKEQWVFRFLYF